MKKILLSAATISGLALLSSCDTTALEQALNASSNNSGYGRPPAYNYDSGYNPYRPAYEQHKDNQAQQNRHAFQVGYRLGADDFHHGHQKKYMRHANMYDSKTRDEFKSGYYSGYEETRNNYNHHHKKKR